MKREAEEAEQRRVEEMKAATQAQADEELQKVQAGQGEYFERVKARRAAEKAAAADDDDAGGEHSSRSNTGEDSIEEEVGVYEVLLLSACIRLLR